MLAVSNAVGGEAAAGHESKFWDMGARNRGGCAAEAKNGESAAGKAKFEVWLARRKRSKFEALLLAGAPQAKRNLKPR